MRGAPKNIIAEAPHPAHHRYTRDTVWFMIPALQCRGRKGCGRKRPPASPRDSALICSFLICSLLRPFMAEGRSPTATSTTLRWSCVAGGMRAGPTSGCSPLPDTARSPKIQCLMMCHGGSLPACPPGKRRRDWRIADCFRRPTTSAVWARGEWALFSCVRE